jgi:hypothetical protein
MRGINKKYVQKTRIELALQPRVDGSGRVLWKAPA